MGSLLMRMIPAASRLERFHGLTWGQCSAAGRPLWEDVRGRRRDSSWASVAGSRAQSPRGAGLPQGLLGPPHCGLGAPRRDLLVEILLGVGFGLRDLGLQPVDLGLQGLVHGELCLRKRAVMWALALLHLFLRGVAIARSSKLTGPGSQRRHCFGLPLGLTPLCVVESLPIDEGYKPLGLYRS